MFANHEHNRNDMIIYKLLTYNICINHYSYTNMTNVLIFKWLWASDAGDPNGISTIYTANRGAWSARVNIAGECITAPSNNNIVSAAAYFKLYFYFILL